MAGSNTARVPRRPRVLLVEDDGDTRELWALVLRGAGFHVLTTESAADGLTALRGEDPIDVVVCDYWLSDAIGGWPRTVDLSHMIEAMASPQSTYRVIAEGDDDVGRGLPITEALAVAEFAREHGKRHVAIVDEQTSAIVDEGDARRRFIAPQ